MLTSVVLLAVAFAAGFRPDASPVEWLAATGLLLALVTALVWLAVALGVVSRDPESASNLPTPIIVLPYLGSGLVPTDGMPAGVRQFAEYQPFSPVADTLRGLLMGTPIGDRWIVALAWCAVIAIAGYLWATRAFRRGLARA